MASACITAACLALGCATPTPATGPYDGTPETSGAEAEAGTETETGSETDSETETGTDELEPITCDGYDEADYPDQPVTFSVEGDRAIMAGYVDGTTPGRVEALLADHPEVELLIMPFVPGSDDDEANLEAARMIHAAGLHTCVPAEGLIASGGVDFFLAGARRAAGEGARLGVHSWATGDGIEGGDLPMDHPDHQLFLDFYADIGIDAAFYWFTLEAAPAADIHWMSVGEMATYGVLTD